MRHVYETQVYDAPERLGVRWRRGVKLVPVSMIRIHYELNFKSGPKVRLKLFQLYVHSAGGLAGRPGRRHFEVPFFSDSGPWPRQHRNF